MKATHDINLEALEKRMHSRKELVAVGNWQPRDKLPTWRRSASLAIDGRICEDIIVFEAYPNIGCEGAKCYYGIEGTAIQAARLDMGDTDGETFGIKKHNNHHKGKPANLPLLVSSPHAHLWDDNRNVFTQRKPGKELPFATELPRHCISWEKAVEWFLNRCYIFTQDNFSIDLPRRDNLL